MRQIKNTKYLCNENGSLNEYSIGWGNTPFKDCSINKNIFIKKIWNRYMWISKEFILNFSIFDLGYISILNMSFFDLENFFKVSKKYKYPISKSIILDDKINSYVHFKSRNKFINILRSSNYINIDFKWDDMDLNSKVYLDYESLNLVVPWDYKYFHYTSKHMRLKTQGYLNIESKKYNLDNSNCFIDYGRGVWNRKAEWEGLITWFKSDKNENISINLVNKYTDNTGLNENCIKINDKIYKFKSDICFNYDKNKKLINIKSLKNDEVNLYFKIIEDNNKSHNAIFFRFKEFQKVGIIFGYIKYKDRRIEIKNTIGWCEKYFAKW
ncbi:MAG: DUF2804 family protein [Paraclostridium sordellii]